MHSSLREGSALDIPSAGPEHADLTPLPLDARIVAAILRQHSPSDPRHAPRCVPVKTDHQLAYAVAEAVQRPVIPFSEVP